MPEPSASAEARIAVSIASRGLATPIATGGRGRPLASGGDGVALIATQQTENPFIRQHFGELSLRARHLCCFALFPLDATSARAYSNARWGARER